MAQPVRYWYPGSAVTVDMVLLTVHREEPAVLLIKRKWPPFEDCWALPGGFVEPDEDLPEAACRELAEEASIHELGAASHLEQLGAYGTPGRDPRMRVVSVAFVAFVPDAPEPHADDDASSARFWMVAKLFGGEEAPALAFDHSRILREGFERARSRGWV